jgi:collagen type III alpha
MRPLRLHASALNNDEYDLYTSSLKELAEIEEGEGGGGQDDEYFERITLGVREVRAWIRGRYSSLPAATVDTVSSRYFL